MASRHRTRWVLTGSEFAAVASLIALLTSASFPQSPATESHSLTSGQAIATPAIKPDAKKAKEAYQHGLHAEQTDDWQSAYDYYKDAIAWAPNNHDYFLRSELAKSRLVRTKVDTAESDAVSGRLGDARLELLQARSLDPTNTVIRDRIAELTVAESGRVVKGPVEPELAGAVHLNFPPDKKHFQYRGDTRGAYEHAAQEFGVEVAFDADLVSRTVNIQLDDANLPTILRLLGTATDTFWRPLTGRLFLVVADNPQKRRDYDASVVRTVLLPAAETPDQMTELQRMVRDITGITRSDLDAGSRTLTLRASPQAMSVATQLIDQLEEPRGELILEIEILEVDKASARQLGITPPESARVFTLSPQQLEQAQQGGESLVNVISQIFGLPSSLAGLSPSQIASLIASNQFGAAALLPPLVAFGGGQTTFLATVPGATANFSEMLSLVRHGRRILLRAEDGQPATFFVGDRIPVSLGLLSPSLGTGGSTVSPITTPTFPTTTITVGNVPSFVATAIVRNNSSANDLIVANSTDNNVGVLLGNGDGTFNAQTTFPTEMDPVWIAMGNFNPGTASDTNLDLAVANKGSNSVSILLGDGLGNFTAGMPLTTGASPVSVAAADFHDTVAGSSLDLAVVNQDDNSISIFQGNGDGTFQAPTLLQLPGGFSPAAITAADFNKDGHIDLAVADQGNNTVSVFLGNGDGTFQARADYNVGNTPVFVTAGDFNGDSVLDLALADSGAATTTNNGNSVSILLGQTDASGNPTGAFTAGTQRDFTAGNGPVSIAVADFNVDGIADLVVADQNDNAISVLLGSGGGLFSPNLELPVGTNPLSVATANFNADSLPDVVAANSGSNNVSVILDSPTFSSRLNGLPGSLYPGAEYLDVGLKVKATPRIHPNQEVTLQLAFEISSLSTQNFNTIPVINNEMVNQTVRVKENETSVLAGILEPQVTNAITGTPGVAQIPGLGLLDTNSDKARQDTELLILVTPREVRAAEHKNNRIYAGQGSLDNGGAGAPPPAPEPQQPPLGGAAAAPENPPAGPANQAPAQAPGQAPGQPSAPAQTPPPDQAQAPGQR